MRREDRRPLALALLVGAGHAAGVAALVLHLDYPIDPLEHAPGGHVGAIVGLVLGLGVPAFVSLRHRLALPLATVTLTGGWAVWRELTTPPPEFSTLGGYTVVAGPRYLDAYVDAWYVWLFAALLLGLAERVARTDWAWLPVPARDGRLDGLLAPGAAAARRTAALVGGGHLAVLLLLAADWDYFAPGGFLPAPWYVGLGVLAWTVLGLVAIGAAAAWLLVQTRLVVPTVGLAWLVHRVGWLQHLPLPDDPLPVYFLGWFVFAGGLVALGGAEYGLRLAARRIELL